MNIYNILEVANSHGGNFDYIMALIDEFEEISGNIGMKFQPFKYDEIAMKDYDYYDTYKELYLGPEQWSEIIEKAARTKDIWLDMFDTYSTRILKDNLQKITGIKFQASTLNNYKLLNNLEIIDLSDINIILNISSYTEEQIFEVIQRIEENLSPREIILQVGFQDYPTSIENSGLNKISVLKENFENRISFGDHTDANDINALYLPIKATILGASIIEKHIRHSSLETKYDGASSLNVGQFREYRKLLNQYLAAMSQPFINEKETEYLQKSLQVPVLCRNMAAGSLLDMTNDLDFKRSSQKGLNVYEIRERLADRNILVNDVPAGRTLSDGDFRKAKIAAIIACRLKSTRLPRKALQKIGDLPSIELCIKNVLKFEDVDYTILATSTVQEDAELENHTYSDSVIFHRGDPDDVIRRYLDVVDELGIDVIVRITADCPYVSNDVLRILLASHFENGADYTVARQAAIGTNLELMNASALRKIKEHFPHADYSEYMTYYFTNNPDYFKLNFVDLPWELIRDYRLTLDYPEDLEMFRKIEEHFKNAGQEYSIRALFEFLDNNTDIASINAGISQRYLVDRGLIETLKRETTIKDGDK